MPRTGTPTPTSSPARADTRRLPAALGVGLCLALGAAAGHALAQVPLDQPPLDEHDAHRLDRIDKAVRELRAIVFQGRETGQPVVVQPADTGAQLGRLTDRLGDIEQTLAKLNGEIEVIRHDADTTRRENDDLRSSDAALKEQVAALQAAVAHLQAPPPPPTAAPEAADGPAAPGAAPPDPSAAFAQGRAALEQGDATTAEADFRAFIEAAGDGPRGPEARYYLARTLIARKAWPEAATADIGAIRGWPRTTWAPAAVLDLSRALIAMQKPQDACQTLGELARRYPKAPSADVHEAARLRAQAGCG